MRCVNTRIVSFCLVTAFCIASPCVQAQTAYQKAPKAIQEVLDAPLNPTLLSISPVKDRVVLATRARYLSIAELSEPVLRLAGLSINPRTNGPGRSRPRTTALLLKSLVDGKEARIDLPPDADPDLLRWSPDGKRFALANTTRSGIELLIGDSATGRLRKVEGARINAAALGDAIQWLSDSETLLVQTVVAGHGPRPVAPFVPAGPIVQENFGKATPGRTFQGLLESPHHERLFAYYATSQLALVGAGDGKLTPLGKPAVFKLVGASPDGNYVLVATVQHPYSYLHTAQAFPAEIEVWDRGGRVVHKVASLPLADQVPLEGVPTGPRACTWRPAEGATLVWVEALDGGDPRKAVPWRDVVKMLRAPFTGPPVELARTEHRYRGINWGETGGLVLIEEYDRKRRWTRTSMLDADSPAPKVVWDRSIQDLYNNPGAPLLKRLPNGQSVMHQDGDDIFLSGPGATARGDRPFLARFNLKTLKSDEVFRSREESYERLVALLADDASRFLTSRETPDTPPNYFVRSARGGGKEALTSFADPTPQLRGIRKELVRYKRKDGVELSFTLYLPPDYRAGTPLPTILWAYPVEFTDAGVAGQVSGSPNRFTSFGGASHLFFALMGYAVLHNATMPVIGDPETANDTYIEQIVASAAAAIDKAVEMGVTDRARVGVGGHSYGAFMTANLLAHSRLFKAGIARSGAYNRTLTPFGFQRERRTFWEAPQMYVRVSPFAHAEKIEAPLLIMHGAADTNAGTHLIQSERMYQAVKGNGGSVRYVRLPLEGHAYAARESIEHALWEMLAWADRHVKGAPSAMER